MEDDVDTAVFLDLYQKERILWDRHHADYHDQSRSSRLCRDIHERISARERIATALGIGVGKVGEIFNRLRCDYLQETIKMSEDDNYNPTMEGFQTMAIIMKQLSTSTSTAEEDIPCDVCKQPDCEMNNNMIFCDQCNVCVHQVCYGVDRIPEGSWYCKPCELNIQPSCLFCLQSKGAMKSTSNGKWAHISCTLWIPEVSFAEPERMETIINIDKIPKTRWTLSCFICRKKGGACIQCYVPRCKTAYHVTCAYKKGLHMAMEDVESSENEVKFESFCKSHTKSPSKKKASKDHSSKKPGLEKTSKASDDKNESITQPFSSVANFASTSADTSINAPLKDVEMAPLENGNGAFEPSHEVPFIGEASVRKKATARKSFPFSAQEKNKKKQLTDVIFKNPQANKLQVTTKVPKEQSAKRKANQSAESELPPPSLNEPGTPRKKLKSQSTATKSAESELPSLNEPSEKKRKLDEQSQSNETPQDPNTPSTSRSAVCAIRELFPTPQNPTAILLNEQELATENEPQSLSNNHPPSVSGNQSPLIQNRNQTPVVSNNQTTSIATGPQDQTSSFLGYLESLLRDFPSKKSLKIQGKLISYVLKEHDVSSSSDEISDASSVSD